MSYGFDVINCDIKIKWAIVTIGGVYLLIRYCTTISAISTPAYRLSMGEALFGNLFAVELAATRKVEKSA